MEYLSAKQAAIKWEISRRRVAALCSEGRIKGAVMAENSWMIPAEAAKPADGRKSRYREDGEAELKPFVKWAGGKGQLLKQIRKAYPPGLGKTITKYAEPFVGGGAVLFDILSSYELREIYISDINPWLINAYKMIRDQITPLLGLLDTMHEELLPLQPEQVKSYYYEKRSLFNLLKSESDHNCNIELAALFIFLNRTCFNGLYRVNSKGDFNVPIGTHRTPVICDSLNLSNISAALENVRIVCGDYRQCREFTDHSTLVYFDPPYRPLSDTAKFTSYTEQPFDDGKQAELAVFIGELGEKGSKIILSNSDPKNSDQSDFFFDHLYGNYSISRIKASRRINCNSGARGRISELLIANFPFAKI